MGGTSRHEGGHVLPRYCGSGADDGAYGGGTGEGLMGLMRGRLRGPLSVVGLLPESVGPLW